MLEEQKSLVKLEENYRSSSNILNAANALIKKYGDNERIDKELK